MTQSRLDDLKNLTLWNQWQQHARSTPEAEAIVHWTVGNDPYRWTWGRLIGAALRYATRLYAEGVRPGQVCALIIRHNPQFYPIYLGIDALGAIPAVLAYPNPRLHPEKFRQGLEGMARHSGLDWLLTEEALDPLVRPLTLKAENPIRSILFPLQWEEAVGENGRTMSNVDPMTVRLEGCTADPRGPCLLQHSSGTTGLQKAVVLSHRAVIEHIHRLAETIAIRSDDKIVSWLPLYHDMGLIASFHLPLCLGLPSVQLDPFEWVVAPSILLEVISREKATLTWLPNFAYNIMADRVHEEDLAEVRLDSLRMAISCSEPVRQESFEKFLARFAPYGMRAGALAASYAMAETTFAVTQTIPDSPPRKLKASRRELAQGRYQPAQDDHDVRFCVSSGPPITGCTLRVVDDTGKDVADGLAGEILIRSVSMFDGYRNNPEKTAEVLRNGWYHSGDLGFRYDGEYFIIGRTRDIIIVAGKNLYPEDIEDAINGVAGVIPGRVVALGVEDESLGTEQIAVVAETGYTAKNDLKALRQAIVEAGMAIDVTIAYVCLVPPRWLIKSSAGKPSRSANKRRVLEEFGI